MSAGEPPQTQTQRRPPLIEGFRIDGRVGEGGMGVVYRAVELSTGLPVALKTVRGVDEKELLALRREIQALCDLDHPGVVRVRAHGMAEGRPWYAMDLLSGDTYASLLDAVWPMLHDTSGESSIETAQATPVRDPRSDRSAVDDPKAEGEGSGGTGPPEVDDSLPAGRGDQLQEHRREVCGGDLPRLLEPLAAICPPLAYLHGRGVVHRDLKPPNVFLAGSGAVLGDFGVVYRSGRGLGREVLDVSQAGIGTIAYMAPEQIRGRTIDARADLYSLGCMLYQALTGRLPFEGPQAEVLTGHLRVLPRPPSELVWGVPAELEELTLRLLEKDPRRRPGYTVDVGRVLRRHLPTTPSGDPETDPEHEAEPYLYWPSLVERDELCARIGEQVRRGWAGDAAVVAVSGPSGCGKTALLGEVARGLTEVAQVVAQGAGSELPVETTADRAALLEPLRPLLRAIADHCSAGDEAERRRLLLEHGAALGRYEPSLLACLPEGASPAPDLPAESERSRLYEALIATLRAYGEGRRILVVLDDLHWADEITLGFLSFLVERRESVPGVVVLASCRREAASDQLVELLTLPRVGHLQVPPLSEEGVLNLVSEMLAARQPPHDLARVLLDRSDGSPYLVIEYLGALVRHRVVRRQTGGSWSWDADRAKALLAEAQPESVRGLVSQRLRPIPLSAQPVLETAAVLGREFDAQLLMRASSGITAAAFDRAVNELIGLSVLEDVGRGRLRFVHDQLRAAAGEQLSHDRRRTLHRTVAETLEATEDRAGAPDEVLGDHWSGAGETARALDYWERAADSAMRRFAARRAIALYGALLEHAEATVDPVGPVDPLRRARWHRQLAEAHLARAEHDDCVRSARLCLAALGAQMPATAAGWWLHGAMHGVRQLWRRRAGNTPDLAPAEEAGRCEEAYRVLRIVARSFYWRNEVAPALATTFRSVNLVERLPPGADRMVSYSMAAGISQLLRAGRLSEQYYTLALNCEGADEEPVGYAEALNSLGVIRLGAGRWIEARAALEESERLTREMGYRVLWETNVMTLATMDDLLGGVERALGGFVEAFDSASRGNRQTLAWALLGALRCHLMTGNLELARECIRRLEELRLSEGDDPDASLLTWRAYSAWLAGDREPAGEWLEAAQAAWTNRPVNYSAYTFLAAGHEVCWQMSVDGLGRGAEAGSRTSRWWAAALSRQARFLRRCAATFEIGRSAASRARAHLALHRGSVAAARDHLRRSITEARDLEQPAEEARALTDIACFGQLSRDESLDLLRRAVQAFDDLGLRPERRRARERLSRLERGG